MMKKLGCVLLLAAFMGCTTTASAGNPLDGLFGLHVPDTADCVGKWCPDDYCPKPEPCADSKLRFLCDDYCPKPAPCVRSQLCFTFDNFRRKCLPKICFAPRCADLSCQPGKCGSCADPTCHQPTPAESQVQPGMRDK